MTQIKSVNLNCSVDVIGDRNFRINATSIDDIAGDFDEHTAFLVDGNPVSRAIFREIVVKTNRSSKKEVTA